MLQYQNAMEVRGAAPASAAGSSGRKLLRALGLVPFPAVSALEYAQQVTGTTSSAGKMKS